MIDSAENCLRDLGVYLGGLVGAEGYRALVERSLHLATSDFRFLESVHPEREAPGQLVGLHQALRRRRPAEVRDALVAILAGLISLLTTFVGEELTLRLMHDVWPAIVHLGSNAASELRDDGQGQD